MKLAAVILGSVFLAVMVFFSVRPAPCFAEERAMSADPRFEKAMESFRKGQGYMEKASRELRARPGLAQKLFEHAEDYFLKAGFLYRETGHEHGIDVSHEAAVCEKAYRQAHVQVNKAMRKKKRGKVF